MIFEWFECGGVIVFDLGLSIGEVVIDLGLSIGEVCGGRRLLFDQRQRAARWRQKEIGEVCVEVSNVGGEICDVGGRILFKGF